MTATSQKEHAFLQRTATGEAAERAALYKELSHADLLSLLFSRDAEIENIKKTRRYGLVWEEKPEEFDLNTVGKIPVLSHVPSLGVASSPNAQDHVLIKGDNYHALKALTFTHEGAVDVIYIDPPYNTGNKDFKYNDKFVDREDGYRHSKWLSFMAKRLRLAKQLLKDSGVIFLSIDDNEQAALKLLCDDVFGECNHVATVVWKKKTGSGKHPHVFDEHEYVHVYAKNKPRLPKWRVLSEDHGNFTNPDGSHEPWESCALTAPSKNRNPNQHYTVQVFEDQEAASAIPLPSSALLREFAYGQQWVRLVTEAGVLGAQSTPGLICESTRRWAYIPESMEREVFAKNRAYINGMNVPRLKKFKSDYEGKALRSLYWDEFSSAAGTAELSQMFDGVEVFAYPKPVALVKHFVGASVPKDGIVLDFFAGSGSTAHAVMQLNAEDGEAGKRRCILVTNDEGEFKDADGSLLPGGICTNVTYPRLRKVIEGYSTPKGKEVAGLAANLHFYETKFVEEKATRSGRQALMAETVDMLNLKEGCFTAVKSSDKRWKTFTNGSRHLVVLFDGMAGEECAAAIENLKGDVAVYAFSFYEDDDIADDFEHLPNVRVRTMPDALLKAYRRLTLNKTIQ